MAFGIVNIGTTATKIISANTQRQSLILTNASLSGIVYLGPDSTLTSAHAGALLSGYGSLTEDSGGARMFQGDIYGITVSAHGTADVCYWERLSD